MDMAAETAVTAAVGNLHSFASLAGSASFYISRPAFLVRSRVSGVQEPRVGTIDGSQWLLGISGHTTFNELPPHQTTPSTQYSVCRRRKLSVEIGEENHYTVDRRCPETGIGNVVREY